MTAINMTAINTPAISVDVEGTVLTLEFSNGKTIELDIATLSPEIYGQAALHGLKQKLVDAAAIARDTVTGRTASIEDKYIAVRDVFDRITHATSPTWNKIREGAAGGNNGLLVRALMELSGKGRNAIEEFLAPKTKEQKRALRQTAKVAEIIVRLQAENTDESIDTSGMLEDLMGDMAGTTVAAPKRHHDDAMM